jgi:hypothetical protein
VTYTLIAALFLCILVYRLLGRRRGKPRPEPEGPVEEIVAAGGRYKAVVYAHAGSVMRVELYRWVDDDPSSPYWTRMSGASFVERASLHREVTERLRGVSGEPET